MYAISQLLAPACLTRAQYWLRLIILVPLLIAWSAFAMAMVKANGGSSGLPPVGVFINLAIIGAVIARLHYVGIAWLYWLGGILGLLYLLAPFVVLAAFLAAPNVFGAAPLAGPNGIQTFSTATGVVQFPFVVLALAAGILKGDPQRRLQRLGERIARAPQSAKLYFTRGRYLAGLERTGEALADFDMALKLKPNMRAAQQAKDNIDGNSAVQKRALAD